jgi:hypothetical protein
MVREGIAKESVAPTENPPAQEPAEKSYKGRVIAGVAVLLTVGFFAAVAYHHAPARPDAPHPGTTAAPAGPVASSVPPPPPAHLSAPLPDRPHVAMVPPAPPIMVKTPAPPLAPARVALRPPLPPAVATPTPVPTPVPPLPPAVATPTPVPTPVPPLPHIITETVAKTVPKVAAPPPALPRLAIIAPLPASPIASKPTPVPAPPIATPMPTPASVPSLPFGTPIHLRIVYAASDPVEASQIAGLTQRLRSEVGDIVYFFPTDRADASRIAASLAQLTKRAEPVVLGHSKALFRPGTIEIRLPPQSMKGPQQ